MSTLLKEKQKSLQSQTTSTKQYSPPVQKKLHIIRSVLQNAMNQIRQQQSSCRALSFIKRISLNLDFQRIQKMLQDLEKGYLVKKHSVNTSEPHEKFIYISQDHRFLCWKSLQKNDEKMIELRKINSVMKDQISVTGKIKPKTINEYNKVLIINSQTRVLELEFISQKLKLKCYEQLIHALKNSKRMHLSYQF